MPRRKRTKRTTVKDLRTILRLTHELGLSVRAISERLGLSKTSVATYLLRAREAGLSWPLAPDYESDAALAQALFRRVGRPPQDLERARLALCGAGAQAQGRHPDPAVAGISRRPSRGLRLHLVLSTVRRLSASSASDIPPLPRSGRSDADRLRWPDGRGDRPADGEIGQAQIFVAVLGASSLTFACASLSQRLPDWIDSQTKALAYFGGVPKAIVCDNLKAGVAKALWFEPTLNQTFAAMAEHYDTTILPTRSRKPRDKGKVEGAVLIVERWILARLRNRRFFSLAELNAAIGVLLEDLNNRPMRQVGKSRRQLFEEIERTALAPLPSTPFEYAEWKSAKVHPDYHVEVDKTFYSVPHRLIGHRVDVRLTHKTIEIFYDHQRVASHIRRSQRSGHVTVNEHMPKAHQRYANMTPASLILMAARIGANAAILVERVMRDRPHPEQGYRSAMGIIALARRYERHRLEAACERALAINAISYSSVSAILKTGLDRTTMPAEPAKATPPHANIRGGTYYQ